MIKLRIQKTHETVEVAIIPHKGTNDYSYINLTEGHICPSRFESIEEAVSDLRNYPEIVSFQII